MEENPTQPKLILVTGGAGFIGSHLCERLAKEGHRVISLDNYFTGSRDNHVPGVEYREGHTKDIEQHIPESPDLIYHLGEYSRVEKSFEDIETVWDLNKTGTFAVLEFARLRKSKIIYAGSSTKFGDGGLGRDQSPYAWSKATNTELVQNYAKWFGVPYAITYFYNVYGPRERSGAYGTVIEIFRQNYLAGKPYTIVSPGTQTRNFTHVHDIVDGLVLVGEKGEGDEYGLGDNTAYSIRNVAEMFGGEIVLLPERAGNRLVSEVKTEKAEALGWKPRRHLREYIQEIKTTPKTTTVPTNRILVFTTTFYPFMGPAERALYELIESLPDVQFDVVTSTYSRSAQKTTMPLKNVTIHRIGNGNFIDKYLLSILGAKKGDELTKNNSYLFIWSLMASYGTLAAISARNNSGLPLLVTLADQRITWKERAFLRFTLNNADQVYASNKQQERNLMPLAKRMQQRNSLGSGDAFANQIRFAYSTLLNNIV